MPYFKDLYLYHTQNKLPYTKSAIRKVKMLAERYMLLESLLFRLVTMPEKVAALLAIQEIYANKIITLYHSSVFAGYQGVKKTFLTIWDEFFVPSQMHHLRLYIKICHICQLSRNEKQLQVNCNKELI